MAVKMMPRPSGAHARSIVQPAMRALDGLAAFWAEQPTESARIHLSFWLLLIAICAARAFIGLAGMRQFSHDAFLVLDGAWRMVNGQRPHLDFNSMVGPVAYLPTVLGFQLCGSTAAGFGYGQAIAAFGLGAWAFLLGRSLAPVPRAAFALSVAAIAGSPAQIGPSPFELTPGMTYNRYTYALLGLVLLECVQGPGDAESVGGFSSGIALGLMAFLKMTGVVIEFVLLVSLLPLRRQTGRRWLGFAAGVFVAALPLLAYLHFDLADIWRDLQLTAAAKHMVFYDRFDFESIFFEVLVAALITLQAAWLLRECGREGSARRMLWTLLVVIVASLGLILGNYQRATLPLVTLLMVLLIDAVVQQRFEHGGRYTIAQAATVAGASVFVALLGVSLAVSLISGIALKVVTAPHRPHFHTPVLASFVPVGDDIGYTDWANDGFDLLQAHRRAGEHVMSLDFTNPFTFGLHLPPAAGGTTNLQYHGSFDDHHKVSPERLFGAAELVMLPRVFTDPTLVGSVGYNYGAYLHQHYALVAETGVWELYRRRP